MFVLLLARMVAHLHRLFINSVLTCTAVGQKVKCNTDVTLISQLVLDHLLGDVVLVGKGGNSAEHLARRHRVRGVLTYVAVHHLYHLFDLI